MADEPNNDESTEPDNNNKSWKFNPHSSKIAGELRAKSLGGPSDFKERLSRHARFVGTGAALLTIPSTPNQTKGESDDGHDQPSVDAEGETLSRRPMSRHEKRSLLGGAVLAARSGAGSDDVAKVEQILDSGVAVEREKLLRELFTKNDQGRSR